MLGKLRWAVVDKPADANGWYTRLEAWRVVLRIYMQLHGERALNESLEVEFFDDKGHRNDAGRRDHVNS